MSRLEEWYQAIASGFMIFLRHWLSPTFDLPPAFIPSDLHRFISDGRYCRAKWVIKYLKRRAYFYFWVRKVGRVPVLQTIPTGAKRILWINWSAPSIGDALMDLCARNLLQKRSVVLLTQKSNYSLFKQDPNFVAVFDSPLDLSSVYPRDYFEVVICDSFSPRVTRLKRYLAPDTPMVGLYGFVNGFEVHRTYFAVARMKQLLGLTLSKEPDRSAKPLLFIDNQKSDKATVLNDICIAIGGEWSFRTYDRWAEVIALLEQKDLRITLVGSSNGELEASALITRFPHVKSLVGKTTICEAAEEISLSRLFLGCDGGLWHCAAGLNVPSLVLFADCQLFSVCGTRHMRHTDGLTCSWLYDPETVKNITPKRIVDMLNKMLPKVCGDS